MATPWIVPVMLAVVLVLGLSACTNPYDPMQRFVAAVSSAQAVGRRSGVRLPAVTVRRWAPRSAELLVR
jgi:hypothetical protein